MESVRCNPETISSAQHELKSKIIDLGIVIENFILNSKIFLDNYIDEEELECEEIQTNERDVLSRCLFETGNILKLKKIFL